MKLKFRTGGETETSLVAAILAKHNLTTDWLDCGEADLFDGSIMRNWAKGRDMLLKHAFPMSTARIGILVDSDADGFTSSAIAYQWLKDLFPTLNVFPIIAEGKVHGIIPAMFENMEIDLLLIPDASSSQVEEHKLLAERGIDILCLDHHEILGETQHAVVVNPHHPDCPYPNKNLSGAGVTFKFLEAIDKEFGRTTVHKYYDLAAVSIVSDVMSIKSRENKAIVNIGMANLVNPYFKEIYKADFRLKDKKNVPMTYSFYILPVINATIRVGELEDKMALFQALVGEMRPEIVIARLVSLKGKQDRQKEPASVRIVMDLQKTGRDARKIIFAEAPKTLPKSMTGLVAGQLAGQYERPTLLGRLGEDGNYSGSARNINDSTLENLKDFLDASGLFNWCAGHQSAFGWSLPAENLEAFQEYVDKNLPALDKFYNIDLDLNTLWDAPSAVLEICELADHFATDFKEVLLCSVIEITETNCAVLGKLQNTLKITDESGVVYMKFRHTSGIPAPGKYLVVGEPNANEYAGRTTAQILIKDIDRLDL